MLESILQSVVDLGNNYISLKNNVLLILEGDSDDGGFEQKGKQYLGMLFLN